MTDLLEADPGSMAWRHAVEHGRLLVARIDVDRWALGDLLCSVLPYEDYDPSDPHRRIRHGVGERRVWQFGEEIGLTQQQATRFWKTSGVWADGMRRPGVSWSTYCEANTTRFRRVLTDLIAAYDAGGPAPTVDAIRRFGGLAGAGHGARSGAPRRRGNAARRVETIRGELEAIAELFPETTGPFDRVERGLKDMARELRELRAADTGIESKGVRGD